MNYLNESFADGYYEALCEMEEVEDIYLEGYYDAIEYINEEITVATGKEIKDKAKTNRQLSGAYLGLSAGSTVASAAKAYKNHKEIKELESRKDQLSDSEKKELNDLKRKRFRNAAGTITGGLLTGISAGVYKNARDTSKKAKKLNDKKIYAY